MESVITFATTTLTLIVVCILGVFGGATMDQAPVVRSDLLPRQAAVTIGGFIIASPETRAIDIAHEYGHLEQERLLGPVYLLVVGLPSVIIAVRDPERWYTHWPETWADSLSGVVR